MTITENMGGGGPDPLDPPMNKWVVDLAWVFDLSCYTVTICAFSGQIMKFTVTHLRSE